MLFCCDTLWASRITIYSQYKKKRKLLKGHFLGVKIIDCKNEFISVALPFNKELYSEVLS